MSKKQEQKQEVGQLGKLQVFNTLTRQKELFTPSEGNKVNMYVCGITVYDYCHLGHARMLISFDVIARWFRHVGYELCYVRNITDIDDKILKRSQELDMPFAELTNKFIAAMHEDEAALGIQAPDIEPRATEYIEQIKTMIARLLENGSAYACNNGDVYFSIKTFDGYGKLSGKNPDELLDGARIEIGELKKDARDFALWKGVNPSEPTDAQWDAPWGAGRPGWHIECSAMSTANLGDSFDIHGGGQDLVFPHHENEIAQSEAATGCHYAKYWLHNNAVRVDQVKMSKSLGNFFTIREILETYDAQVVRYFLLSSHYRSPINYSDATLDNARSALERLYTALRGVEATVDLASAAIAGYVLRFTEAMNDDFNTPEALAVIFELARELNIAKQADMPRAGQLAGAMVGLGAILGILQSSPEAFLQGDSEAAGDNEKIEQMIVDRDEAKNNKNYALADELRQQLSKMGIVLEDGREGTTWRRE